MDLYGELSWRGLVYDATEGVPELLARETVTAYIGFDPSAPSLHVGSLLQMMALAHCPARSPTLTRSQRRRRPPFRPPLRC